jgi:hypothetical protein
MSTQADVVVAVEADAKAAVKALLSGLVKDGDAVDMEVAILAADAGAFGPLLAPLVASAIKKVIGQLVDKI